MAAGDHEGPPVVEVVPVISSSPSSRTARRALAAALLAACLGASPAGAQAVNNPPLAPVSILAFPQRDFVSASGYSSLDRVIVKVIHPGGVTLTTDPANPLIPLAAPGALPTDPFAGIVEVNHPGGYCWFGTTPDRKSTRLNSSHIQKSRMPSSA